MANVFFHGQLISKMANFFEMDNLSSLLVTIERKDLGR